MDDTAVRMKLELGQKISDSRALLAELLTRCELAEVKARQITDSTAANWCRRVDHLRNRTIAQAASATMEG